MAERKCEAQWIESRQRWQINVQADGKRRTFTSTTPGRKGKASAERKAEAWLHDPVSTEKSRVQALLDQWVEHLKATKSTTHSRQYGNFVRLYIAPVIGMKHINKLTEGDIQDVIDQAYAKRRLADKTLRDLRGCVLNWVKWCRQHGLTRLHPEDIIIPAGARKSNKGVLDPGSLSTLFSSDMTTWRGKPVKEWYIHAFRFSVLTGVRPGELCGLQAVDVRGSKVTISGAINIFGEETQGKNDNARRTFQLPSQAVEVVAAQKAQLRRAGVISPYLFPDPEGNRFDEPTLYRTWVRYCKANDIPQISLYELRHTFVSVNKEMPDGLKKMAVGHSRDMDTDGTYGHRMAGDLEKAAQYSEAAFSAVIGRKK